MAFFNLWEQPVFVGKPKKPEFYISNKDNNLKHSSLILPEAININRLNLNQKINHE